MLNIVDASSLYLGSKATSQSMIDEFTAQWFEPMNKMLEQLAIQKVRSDPALEQMVSQDEEASSLLSEIGG